MGNDHTLRSANPSAMDPFSHTPLTSNFQELLCSETLPSCGHSQRELEQWAPQTPVTQERKLGDQVLTNGHFWDWEVNTLQNVI